MALKCRIGSSNAVDNEADNDCYNGSLLQYFEPFKNGVNVLEQMAYLEQ